MIDTILGIKKSIPNTSIASLSIELLPEFGWSIGNNQKAFGPGTLFQGNVIVKCKELSLRATCLRLVFQGVESMLAYEMGPGVMRSHTSQLFSIRKVLWKKKDDQDTLLPMKNYKFLFTIQMPMVQFPPSMSHDYYQCAFKLSAYLDPSLNFGEVPVMTQIHIKYIPLIETKLLKSPLYLHDLKSSATSLSPSSGLSASIKLLSSEYVSGGNIQATVYVSNNGTSRISPPSVGEDLSVSLYLYQVSKFNLDAEPILKDLVASQTHVFKNVFLYTHKRELNVSMKISESLPPSFYYSAIMSLSYKLKIKIHLRNSKAILGSTLPIFADSPNTGADSANTVIASDHCLTEKRRPKDIKKKKITKFFTNLWSGSTSVFETPIILGTLESGLRNSDELKEYSQFYGENIDCMPSPCFVKSIEYEDALPKYEACNLPSYGNSSRNSCISRSSCGSISDTIIFTTATASSISTMRNVI